MANYSEETIASWTRPPSDHEEAKLANSEKAVKEAIAEDPFLSKKSTKVFGQGSYANDTNVRLNSDIDINVRYDSVFYFKLPPKRTREEYGLTNSSNYTFTEYKAAVEGALVRKFGRENVIHDDKCLTVKETSTRVEMDVVPTWKHRRYSENGTYVEGVEFLSDKGNWIINFPLQHIDNGKIKNTDTQKRFKRLTRIYRKIRYKMIDEGIPVESGITSFLMECLVWNVSNPVFNQHDFWTERLKESLRYLYGHTMTDETCKGWGEVSELLYLFHSQRKWTRKMVNDYLYQVWMYMGFET